MPFIAASITQIVLKTDFKLTIIEFSQAFDIINNISFYKKFAQMVIEQI